ncbi:MAG: ATP-binding protein [Halopseudomonas sp.]
MKQDIYKVLSQSPGLKGRDIARKLDLNRKEVNSFLDKNKDSFYQDEAFCWFNREDGAAIEFQPGWIDADKYEAVLADFPDLFASEGAVKFVLPKGCNLLLEPISRFLAILNQLDHQGIAVTIDMADCGNTRSFLNRAGFFDLLSESVKVLPKRPSSSTAKIFKGNSDSLVELGTICPDSKNKGLIVALHSSFVDKSSVDYDTVALTVFSEFIGNVSEHSESPLDGFAALQIYQPKFKRDHIQTVISDSGMGVVSTLRSTLEEHYPDLYRRFPDDGIESDIGLVLEVFSKGSITRHGKKSGRGLGFRSTREQASKFDADLSIRLNTFNIKLVYRDGELAKPAVTKDLTKIVGTHICFDFYVD